MITVDTYYLTVLLEYGIAGFISYFGMFLIAIFEGSRRILFTQISSEDRSFIFPVTTSLATFFLIKSVFSQQDNHPVVFVLLGALISLLALQKVANSKSKTMVGSPRVARAAMR